MQATETRITKLEQATPPNIGKVLIVTFNRPGEIDSEIHNLASAVGDDNCQKWTREPGETEQDLIDRAKREVKRSDYGTAVLFKVD